MATTRPGFNTKSPTIKRLLAESRELAAHPDPSLHASPLETNLFEWHFTIAGPPSSPYEHGIYHGRIILPPNYPYRPPMFRFSTPSGRFEVNREICLSISAHHEESWQPAWGIRTALCAIRAFMETGANGQVGGLEAGEAVRREAAQDSRGWKCAVCAASNEEILKGEKVRWEEMKEKGLLKEKKEEVPEELRLAYKDEMDAKKEEQRESTAPGTHNADTDTTNSEASKDNVRTNEDSSATAARPQVPQQRPQEETFPVPSTTQSDLVPARPARGDSTSPTPTPTRTIAPAQTVSTDDGIPAWIDRAIVGVLFSLIVMILKRVLS